MLGAELKIPNNQGQGECLLRRHHRCVNCFHEARFSAPLVRETPSYVAASPITAIIVRVDNAIVSSFPYGASLRERDRESERESV